MVREAERCQGHANPAGQSDTALLATGDVWAYGWATAFDPVTARTWLFADTAMLG